jgi:nucleoside-diphosphate-sugar epimerase
VQWTSEEIWRGRLVLVTGSSGFLGSAVGRVLLDAGAEVHGTGCTRVPTACVVSHHMSLPEDAASVIAQVSPSVVIHLAAPVNPDPSDGAQEAFRLGIVSGTEAVVSACVSAGARLVHVGTCAEYGSAAAPYREDQDCQPEGLYGILKHQASMVVSGTAELDWTIVRPFRAIGQGDDASVVAAAARAAIAGEVFEMTDGTQVREWNHVDAVAQGIVAAAAHPDALRQVINIGGGARVSVRDIVQRIFALADADPALVRVGARARRLHEVEALVGDHTRAESLWGAVMQPTLDESLRSVLSWQQGRIGGAA